MIYKGYSTSFSGVHYDITIGDTGGMQNMIIGTSISISYNGKDDLYQTVIASTATIEVFSDNRLDIIASGPQDVRALIKGSNGFLWKGFLRPEIYSQEYLLEGGCIELEFVDSLSTLKYLSYASSNGVISFAKLIDKLCTQATISNKYYASACNFDLENTFISEGNFVDEDGVYMSSMEVLEELMKYLCMTCFVENDHLYIINYDELQVDNMSLSSYVDGVKSIEIVTADEVDLTKKVIMSGTSISSRTLQQAVNIRVNEYLQKEIVKGLTEDENLTIKSATPDVVYKSSQKRTYVSSFLQNVNYTFYKYYRNSNDNNSPDQWKLIVSGDTMSTISKYIGGPLMSTYSYSDEGKKDAKDVDYTNYLMLNMRAESGEYHPAFYKYGVKALSVRGVSKVVLPEGFIKINFETFCNMSNQPYPNPDAKGVEYTGGFWFRLRIGNKYFNGIDWEWQDVASDMEKIFINMDGRSDSWISATDSRHNYYNGADRVSGFVIPIPKDLNLSGTLLFELDMPFITSIAYPYNVLVKDLTIEYERKLEVVDNIVGQRLSDIGEDSLYTAKIYEDSVVEGDDIELKIATDQKRGLSLSGVLEAVDDDTWRYIDEVTDVTTSKTATQEEHLLNKYLTQLGGNAREISMTIKGTCSLKSIVSDIYHPVMFVLSKTYDIYNDLTNITLRQKL